MLEKLKSFLLNDQLFFAIIVILVGIASFSLGRASVVNLDQKTAPVATKGVVVEVEKDISKRVTEQPLVVSPPMAAPQVGALVGSKSGTKYHLLSCPGAKQIKEENKIYFKDTDAAEAAGYKPAANCPQLQ